MLDVEGRDDADPGVEQLLDVLPALLVARARDVGVCKLVDERDLRGPREDRVHVHLLEGAFAVLDLPARHDLQVADLRRRLGAPVRLDEADDDVLAVVAAAAPLVQHRVGLADARRGAEVDAQLSAGHHVRLRRVERQVELEHVHAGLAEEAERAAVGVLVDEVEHLGRVEAARFGARAAPARGRSPARCADRARSPRRSARRSAASDAVGLLVGGIGARRRRSAALRWSARGWRPSSTSRRSRRRRRTAAGGSTARPRSPARSGASRRRRRRARRASRRRGPGTRPARPRSRRAGRRAGQQREARGTRSRPERAGAHHTIPSPPTTRSISLIPTNGTTRPPRP